MPRIQEFLLQGVAGLPGRRYKGVMVIAITAGWVLAMGYLFVTRKTANKHPGFGYDPRCDHSPLGVAR